MLPRVFLQWDIVKISSGNTKPFKKRKKLFTQFSASARPKQASESESERGARERKIVVFSPPTPTPLRSRSLNPPRICFLSRPLNGLWRGKQAIRDTVVNYVTKHNLGHYLGSLYFSKGEVIALTRSGRQPRLDWPEWMNEWSCKSKHVQSNAGFWRAGLNQSERAFSFDRFPTGLFPVLSCM